MSLADSFEELKNWLREHGGFAHPHLSREAREGVNGIYASAPIAGSERIAEIPRSLVIGPHLLADYAPIPDLIHERDQTLYVFLCEWEKRERSRFYPWFKQLPSTADFEAYHPLFASDSEWAELEKLNPRIIRSLQNFKDRIAGFSKLTGDRFPKQDVLWASLIYLTRAFEGNGLVPFCDFFNHHNGYGRGLIDDRELKTGRPVGAGEEVHISYGANIDSLDLWLHFGFIDATAGPVINCANVKSSHFLFGNDCYIDGRGPSVTLLNACADRKTLASLARALSAEIGPIPESKSALVRQAARLMKDRLALLQFSE